MRLAGFFSICINACFFVASASAYFVVTQPVSGTQWVNGQTNVLSWEKGLLDGLHMFDIEITRMSVDGLIYVGMHVPTKPGGLNVILQDVPAGDDYVAIFLNATHGGLYGTSSRFSILAASSTPTSTPISPIAKAATVTVTSGASPTSNAFATTFPPIANAALHSLSWTPDGGLLGGAFGVTIGCIVGAAWTLMW